MRRVSAEHVLQLAYIDAELARPDRTEDRDLLVARKAAILREYGKS